MWQRPLRSNDLPVDEKKFRCNSRGCWMLIRSSSAIAASWHAALRQSAMMVRMILSSVTYCGRTNLCGIASPEPRELQIFQHQPLRGCAVVQSLRTAPPRKAESVGNRTIGQAHDESSCCQPEAIVAHREAARKIACNTSGSEPSMGELLTSHMNSQLRASRHLWLIIRAQ